MKPSISNEAPGPALLVVQTSFLGDVVLTTPLITALRQHVAPRRLAVLVRPEAAPLVADHPDVDDVLLDDKRGRDGGPFGLLRTARRLRTRRSGSRDGPGEPAGRGAHHGDRAPLPLPKRPSTSVARGWQRSHRADVGA